ncbi:sensor histidine kinase [Novosphingobium album (ex Hu et al. 2023)]|uniref:histidine kinase n=1 Tax=Novosphingobium album (ex Hu et al. 2023) TaxID=2930093 RepID=A0ABT0B6U5_9SPHN|nr:HAMP domain-containing sensor histidine kinase [Novosphingobium album (ex Hu et al. 2023)]MCJ2180802.1 HAMP domain-containing histidine kinase [Novosphingobium album (ex Hu et al. 2023)]
MIHLVAIRHSIFAQIVLWAIFTAAEITFGLWLLTDSTIQRTNQQALERAIDLDLAGMVDIFASGGAEELTKRISDRLAVQPRNGNTAHYLLVDAHDERIAGDIEGWPKQRPENGSVRQIRLDSGSNAYARTTELSPGLRLMVAHEHHDLDVLLRQVALAFLSGGILAVLAVALGGWMAARRLAGRIERINAAFRQPDNSALEDLFLDAEGRDEIDELTIHSGNALVRLKRLAGAHRETTDHVAHEMRTPLMHLDNRLVKALAATPDPETAARIADARTEIRGIIRMLESLLDIAASEARRGDRHGLAPVDLSLIAARLGELYADSAEESGRMLKLDIEPGVIVEGEEMALTRLITNLLDNAFKFVPEGGTVWLVLRKGPKLVVSDDGPGIPEEQRDTIFEKFSKGERAAGSDGAGLGLALCRAIAERHHLEITLVPTGKGACFSVGPETKR